MSPAGPRTAERMLVALDIDGTLMTFDEFMSDEVRAAVSAVRAAGHEVVLATGRPLVATLPVAELLGIDSGWLVCSNGSVVARLDPGEPGRFTLEDTVLFDPGPALAVMAEHLPQARVALEEIGVGYWITDVFPERDLHGLQTVLSFEELCEQRTARVVVADAIPPAAGFTAAIEELGLVATYFTIATTPWMDLAPTGITKAYALENLRQKFDIPQSATVAIGDGDNDIAMLEWAGRGIAMGHAPASVIAVADEITGSIIDDGALAVLNSLSDSPIGQ